LDTASQIPRLPNWQFVKQTDSAVFPTRQIADAQREIQVSSFAIG
jgi:hypothetical protein